MTENLCVAVIIESMVTHPLVAGFVEQPPFRKKFSKPLGARVNFESIYVAGWSSPVAREA